LLPEESAFDSPTGDPTTAAELAHASDPAAATAFSDPETASGPVDAPSPSPPIDLPAPAPEAPAEAVAHDDAPPVRAPVPTARSDSGRLPIQDVLAHLAAEESANRARETPPAEMEAPVRQPASAPAEPPARQRRSTWDFMDDDPTEEEAPPVPQGGRARASAAAAGDSAPVDRAVEPVSRKAGGLPEQWRRVRSAIHDFWSGPGEPRPLLVTGLALAVAVAVALALYSAGYPAPGSLSDPPGTPSPEAGSKAPQAEVRPDPFSASAPYDPPGQAETAPRPEAVGAAASGEVAYVAASLLICRAAPVAEAPRVRNLLRGKEVRVLGYDGAWASLAYSGGQCWAQAQFLSPVPTL
jgi:hypothetical protein